MSSKRARPGERLAGLLARGIQRTPFSPYRQSGITLANYLRHPRLATRRIRDELEWRIFGRRIKVNRPGNVVMFHIGRSGSTVLGDLAGQHPQVFWDGEVYERLFQKWERQPGGLAGNIFRTSPLHYLEKRMLRAGKNYYGFEVKFFHLRLMGLELPEFIEGLKKRGFSHFIILERKNYLRKVVSSLVGRQKSRFHQAASLKASLHELLLDVNDIQIDRDQKPLVEYLRDYTVLFQNVREQLQGENTLDLSYEGDVQIDPQLGYRRICEFLEISPAPVTVPFGKINPYLLRDMLTNYSEVQAMLINTPYEWMLNE